jgi:hypothetical protein
LRGFRRPGARPIDRLAVEEVVEFDGKLVGGSGLAFGPLGAVVHVTCARRSEGRNTDLRGRADIKNVCGEGCFVDGAVGLVRAVVHSVAEGGAPAADARWSLAFILWFKPLLRLLMAFVLVSASRPGIVVGHPFVCGRSGRLAMLCRCMDRVSSLSL